MIRCSMDGELSNGLRGRKWSAVCVFSVSLFCLLISYSATMKPHTSMANGVISGLLTLTL